MPVFTPGRRFQPAYNSFRRPAAGGRFLAGMERLVKGPLFGCRMCGNCLLQETAFICPMECPKGLRNGPCGGSTPDGCYVDPSRPCIWHRIYERADRMGRSDRLMEVLPPLDWSRTGCETWGEVLAEVRRRGYGISLKRLFAGGERRRAYWDDVFHTIRQPDWWRGDDQPHPPPERPSVSRLEEKLANGEFVVTAEVAPPLSVKPDDLVRTLSLLRDWIDAANFTDNPSATPRMSSLACSVLALGQGIEPVMQVAARDRTRMGLQAEILGAAALGVRNVLCLTGDHSVLGPGPQGRMDIWDLDSIQMLWILRRMRDSRQYLDGRAIPVPPQLFLGAAASPFASTPRTQAQRELKKSHAGAQFFQSNLVYDLEGFERYLEALDAAGVLAATPLLVGVTPVRSARAAEAMAKVPGVKFPPALVRRLEQSRDPKEEGVQIALEIISRVRSMPGVRGVHIMAVGWELIVPRLVREAGLKAGAGAAAGTSRAAAGGGLPASVVGRPGGSEAPGAGPGGASGSAAPAEFVDPAAQAASAERIRAFHAARAAARPPERHTNRAYLDALAARVLVFDGALGTNLQRLELTAEDFGGERYAGCNDYLVLQKPAAVESVHAAFLEAGCDVIETCTFRANRLTMAEYGLEDDVPEINRAAAALARGVAARFSTPERPRFVAGSLGPSGKLPSSSDPELSQIHFEELADVFREQAAALIGGGCDLLLIETSQDLLEVKAAIMGVRHAFAETGVRLPLQVQVTLDVSGRMLLGTDVAAVLAALERMPVDVLGLNCSTGPEHMQAALAYLGERCTLPLSCLPNAGLPRNEGGHAVYPLAPEGFARQMGEFVERFGLNAVGGCCGTTPEHIRALVARLERGGEEERGGDSARGGDQEGRGDPDGRDDHDRRGEHDGRDGQDGGRDQESRRPAPRPTRPLALASSGITVASLVQDPAPMLIGERLNAQGSRKMKELLLAEDYDGIAALGREQIEGGGHALDICVAMTERRDEAYLMSRVVARLSQTVAAPLVIDTTEPEVLEAALQAAPGRVVVNAVNMENGRERLDAMLPLIRDYGAATIALTIDEQGMARTAERKLEVARRIHAIATEEYGLLPDALIFDALTFTLATGDPETADSAAQTLEGIRRIKAALPGVLTSLGVSNVSYGFKPDARAVLNSVFLYHAVEAGLDMVIINPKQIIPYAEIAEEQRALAEDLLYNRRPDATARFIAFFEGAKTRQAAAADPTAGMSPAERLRWRIVHRVPDGVEADVDALVAAGVRERTGKELPAPAAGSGPDADTTAVAVDGLNRVLLPAMKEVGDKFGSGELILPFVLQSAEVMKKAVTRLETYLERTEGVSKGRVLLATVYGDVHDIGKNLVKSILVNNGYAVRDLGKQVPAGVIVDQAAEFQADVVGLSALLVSTSRQMPLVVRELHQRGMAVPVLVGGAAINREFGREIARIEGDVLYPGGVLYCRDAFDGLEQVERAVEAKQQASGGSAGGAGMADGDAGDAGTRDGNGDAGATGKRDGNGDAGATGKRDGNGDAGATGKARVGDGKASLLQAVRSTEASGGAPADRTTISARAAARFSVVARPEDVPRPPFWGARSWRDIPLEEVFAHLDERQLFRLSWGAKQKLGAEWQTLRQEFTDRLERMKREALADHWLVPQAAYGYFPAWSDGNELLVFEPALGSDRVAARFSFPRQPAPEYLCIADYFLPVGSPRRDVLAVQVVTVGAGATERFDAMDARDEYSEAYYLHGLAVQTAEATARLLFERVRKELGLAEGRGKRYSWGYGALPDVEEHRLVFRLLPAEAELGLSLTSAGQLVPEQSTAAMIVHHPQAKYFGG